MKDCWQKQTQRIKLVQLLIKSPVCSFSLSQKNNNPSHHRLHRKFTFCPSFGAFTMLAVGALFLRTIKVEHGAGGHRVPRHPRNLAVHQTARMSRKAVCTTDGWSVQLTSYSSRLALSPCLITIPSWECVLCCVCVCVCGGVYLFWGLRLEYAAGNREHVCMVFDLDYVWAHESLMEHSKTKRLHTQFCTKHTGSIFEMF